MNLSMKWLSDYVDIDVTPKQFSDDMTMSGSKVEGYADETAEIKNVVVGKLLSVEPHPNADHLVVCKVDIGLKPFSMALCKWSTALERRPEYNVLQSVRKGLAPKLRSRFAMRAA